MLVAAFEVDVGRPGQLGPDRQHRLVARSGVEPDVEDVHLALERRAAARRARQARRGRTPRSAARTTRRRRTARTPPPPARRVAGVRIGFAAARAVDRRDRHAPRALARDAPVGPVRDHVVDAVVAPRRDPLHLVVDRVRAPPRAASAACAIRAVIAGSPSILMNHCDVARKITGLWQRQQCGYWCANASRCHSRPRSFSACFDVRVRVEHPLAAEQLHGVEEVAGRADRRVDLEAVLHAGVEVVGAVAGRRVHRAGARSSVT